MLSIYYIKINTGTGDSGVYFPEKIARVADKDSQRAQAISDQDSSDYVDIPSRPIGDKPKDEKAIEEERGRVWHSQIRDGYDAVDPAQQVNGNGDEKRNVYRVFFYLLEIIENG